MEVEAGKFHPRFLSWKVSSSFFELKGFILTLLMEVLEGYILALLLNGHRQVESWKILFLFFELEALIFALFMDMLEGYILAFPLEAMA